MVHDFGSRGTGGDIVLLHEFLKGSAAHRANDLVLAAEFFEELQNGSVGGMGFWTFENDVAEVDPVAGVEVDEYFPGNEAREFGALLEEVLLRG